MNKSVIFILIHFMATMVIQLGFFIHSVFFHNYSVKSTLVWIIIGIAITCIDYHACTHILVDKSTFVPRIVHTADLVLIIPNIALWGYSFALDLVNRDIIKPKHSIHDIVLISGIIFVDACFVLERMSLINRNH